MTFYEAAIQVLLREGRPLHAREITELALQDNLLSHVGKQPEVVMASRLAAMARRSQDKRLVAVAEDTFGLADWNLANDPEALERSGIVHPPEEASQPPLRGQERHPKISKDNVRILGRGERRRREDAQRRRRRAARTLPELVLEVLEAAKIPLPLFELAAALREKDLVEDDLGREALEAKLQEENQRMEEEGKTPTFAFPQAGWVGLPGVEPSDEETALQALERAMARATRGKRQRAAAAPEEIAAPPIEKLAQQSREAAVRQLRRRLEELDATALEAVAQALFDELGYTDVRIAKRHKEGALFTMRRRMGLTEIRTGIRVLRGGRDVLREDVQELRKDLQSHSAQMGVLLSPADPTREARAEAAQAGQGLVVLLCADALADQLVERGIGATTKTVTWVQFDPRSLASLARRAERLRDKRETQEERRERREKERQEARERRQRAREERQAKRKAEEAEAQPTPEKTEKAEAKPKPEKTEEAEAKPKPEKTEEAEAKPKPEKTEEAEAKPKPEKTEEAEAKPSPEKTEEAETQPTPEKAEKVEKAEAKPSSSRPRRRSAEGRARKAAAAESEPAPEAEPQPKQAAAPEAEPAAEEERDA